MHSEDVLIDDGRGSWRRKRWSIHDRRLLDIVDRVTFESPEDLLEILPSTLPQKFTTSDLTRESGIRPNIAQKMAYCLREMGVIEAVGKSGRALLYTKSLKT